MDEERFSAPFKSHQVGDYLLQTAKVSPGIAGLFFSLQFL